MNTQVTTVIDNLVEAYNTSNAQVFADCFTENAEIFEHPNILTQQSKAEILAYYQQLFNEFPLNRTEILHRIIMDNRIIDHECVRRTPEVEPFEVLTIYEIDDVLIRRVDFIRKQSVVWHQA
jgi:hypothetical protein